MALPLPVSAAEAGMTESARPGAAAGPYTLPGYGKYMTGGAREAITRLVRS